MNSFRPGCLVALMFLVFVSVCALILVEVL